MEEGINLLYVAVAALLFVALAGIWYRVDVEESKSLIYVEKQLNQERAVKGVD